MGERDIYNVLELAKYNELQRLQGKVDYLTNEIFILELQKTKSTNDILILNRMIDEFQSSVAQKRGETTYMKQESGWYDNTGILYPIARTSLWEFAPFGGVLAMIVAEIMEMK
jgi:hypothetical protein